MPYGVGKRVSHGCFRLYPEDIAALFPLISKGTPVTVIDTNYKLGWQDNRLWLEVMPTQKQSDEIAEYREPQPVDVPGIHDTVEKMAGRTAMIDWYAVDEAISQHNGMPVIVAQRMSN
jgi:L,D-transpeptidase ErfK/SrfK